MELREYLIVYDYGMGGVWAVMRAPSAAVLAAAYPELVVVEERPLWVDDDEYARIKAWSGFEYDAPTEYWSTWFEAA